MSSLLKSILSYFSPKDSKVPLVLHNTWLNAWDIEADEVPTRLVKEIQLCSAHTSGVDERGESVDHIDKHSLLRVFLTPTPDLPQEIILLERISYTNKGYHSVAGIDDTHFKPGVLLHPDINDHVCVIRQGLVKDVVHDLNVVLTYDPCEMSLKDVVAIVMHVAETSKTPISGEERVVCKRLSDSFAFDCFVGLVLGVPPSMGDNTGEFDAWANDAYAHGLETIPEDEGKRAVDQPPCTAHANESLSTAEVRA